jgi:hypothetical protein
VDVEDGWNLRFFFSFELHGGEIDDLVGSGHLSAQKLLRDSLVRIRWLISLISL